MQLDEKRKPRLVLTYWASWYARNQLVYEGSPLSLGNTVAFIHSHSEELDILCSAKSPQLVDYPPKWSPPATYFIKINFDAHFTSATSQSVSGALARDSLGWIVAACVYPYDWIADSFIAEAKACEVVVFFAIDLGLSKVHVEVAHLLARVGLQAGQPQFWFGKAPMLVEQAVRRDLA
ncbi:hypothetical protein V6N13_037685 [Hibiscus sabdariffa]|uniref:RNase H type-1 domain-containing protein n=1 Tax=Hibiscus sabdariffa TaxID=183260 RepID=A0ABR2S4E2_9ROSI